MKNNLFILTLAAWVLVASQVSAQLPFGISAGPRIGTTVKGNRFIAGGQVELKISSFTFAPNVEKIFVKHAKDYNINLDGQYNMYGVGVAQMFIGAGYVINLVKPDGFKSGTNHGYDVQIGGKANLSSLHVFGLIKYTRIIRHGNTISISGESDAALVLGMNFGI